MHNVNAITSTSSMINNTTTNPSGIFCYCCIAVLLKARDGVTLPSYLTLPPLTTLSKGLLPQHYDPHNPAWRAFSGCNLPLVLFVHGGPWHRDVWGLDTTAQWFANRGYAVLQVRFCLLNCVTLLSLRVSQTEYRSNLINRTIIFLISCIKCVATRV